MVSLRDSRSILLPAYNVQATLESHVGRLLEVAGELSGRFEIVIIDISTIVIVGYITCLRTMHAVARTMNVGHGQLRRHQAGLQGHVEPHGNEQRQDGPDQIMAPMSIPSVHG